MIETEKNDAIDTLLASVEKALKEGEGALKMPPSSPEFATLHVEFRDKVKTALQTYKDAVEAT